MICCNEKQCIVQSVFDASLIVDCLDPGLTDDDIDARDVVPRPLLCPCWMLAR